MRIGELAALVGVTPRAVRHYHHIGLLPEPARRGNGYRDYGLRDAVALARVRRLSELGLGLDEVRDALADDAGHELAEVLDELDADLARQEADLRERRKRLARLRAQVAEGTYALDGPVRPGAVPAGLDPAGAAVAALDRDVLALLETGAPPGTREHMAAAYDRLTAAPGAEERMREVYALLGGLADTDPAASGAAGRIEEVARALVGALPPALLGELRAGAAAVSRAGTALPGAVSFLDALRAELAPAQMSAFLRAMELIAGPERGGDLAAPGAEEDR
ncbi:MerR family transcriptional regulator [Streptomyces sp. NPDC007088]|uniref:MerR family transcriptional regulator n=1 Tax=Streptomyces sp. NPDC007088 TaxID=3364773 RepID=UPI00369BC81B